MSENKKDMARDHLKGLNKTNSQEIPNDEPFVEKIVEDDETTEIEEESIIEVETKQNEAQNEEIIEETPQNSFSETQMEEVIDQKNITTTNETTGEINKEDLKENYIDGSNEGYRREIEDLDNNFIVFKNVSKNYMSDSYSVQTLALDNISFDIKEGELVIMLGHSGAGKTTTLNLLGGMDTATSGRIIVGDKEISNYSLDQLTEYRKNDIGFVFQSYNLVQNLTVKENIDLATEIKNQKVDASIILEKVGLPDKLNAFPVQLSGGEQQRVAIARAMAKKPKILLCDEPTGALDDVTGKQILSLIQKTCKKEKVTTIIITHNIQLTDMADKVICFNSGKVTKIIKNTNPKNVEDLEW